MKHAGIYYNHYIIRLYRPVDPRVILRKISESHSQFQARRGGAVGGEQHDAQELSSALLGSIVENAQLDKSSNWSSLESALLMEHSEERSHDLVGIFESNE